MKKEKPTWLKLAAGMACISVVTAASQCLQHNQKPMVKRGLTEKQLRRRLTAVSILYHLAGIFYND